MQVRQLLGAAVYIADGIDAAARRQFGGRWGKLDHDGIGYQSDCPLGKGCRIRGAVEGDEWSGDVPSYLFGRARERWVEHREHFRCGEDVSFHEIHPVGLVAQGVHGSREAYPIEKFL